MLSNGDRPLGEGNLRVLVVEDEALVALILEDMLIELGHQIVGPFAAVGAGLESAKNELIDIAILDLNIKGVSSLPIANALKTRDIPIVFSTGYGRDGLPDPFGNAPMLQKPFQQSDIEEAIVQAFSGN